VIELPYGFHILKVDDRVNDVIKPFDEVKATSRRPSETKRCRKQTAVFLKKAWSETTVWVAPAYQARLAPLPEVP
jgi:parvulin-like peptidyl-prolyl isomerase